MELKYHRLITVLTELALVCLLFVTIVGCIPRTVTVSQAPAIRWEESNDGLSADKDTASDQVVAFGNGTVADGNTLSGIYANGESSDAAIRVELQPDESGKLSYFINGSQINSSQIGTTITDESGNGQFVISGSRVEAVTDEDGNIFYQINSNVENVQQQTVPSVSKVMVSISAVGVLMHVCELLACVLLLLYVMKFFNHSKANLIMMLVFAASFLPSALSLASYLPVLSAGTFVLFYCLRSLVECILFALLAVLALKNTLTTKVSLIAMIGLLGSYTLPYLSGISLGSADILDTISNLLGIVGFLAFTVSWFLCSFKEQAAPASEAVEAVEPVAPAGE